MATRLLILSLLWVLSIQRTVLARQPKVAQLQNQLSKLQTELEQFRDRVNIQLDEIQKAAQPSRNYVVPPPGSIGFGLDRGTAERAMIISRLERLERKLIEWETTTRTTTVAPASWSSISEENPFDSTQAAPRGGRGNDQPGPRTSGGTDSDVSTAKLAQISNSNFAFSAALHEALGSQGETNLVFSPFSVSLPLVLAKFGAPGRTGYEINRALRFSPELIQDSRSVQSGFHQLLKSIRNPAADYNVSVASAIYAQRGLQIREEFRTVCTALDTPVRMLDFARAGLASESINTWVETKTDGKIKQLVSPSSLRTGTKIVMVNAISFKSPWEYKFWSSHTRKQPFHLNSTASVEVDMMFTQAEYSFAQLPELDAKLVVIPYKGGRFSMYVYVPEEIDGLDRLQRGLRHTSMDDIRGKIQQTSYCHQVALRMPKFKIESTLNLKEPLKQMGVQVMFSEADADFSGITGERTGSYVSSIIQKAYIEVDEEGTDAAAATAIRMVPSCMPSLIEITADRPFYYQIADEQIHIIYFAGTVRNPNI